MYIKRPSLDHKIAVIMIRDRVSGIDYERQQEDRRCLRDSLFSLQQ